MSKANFKTLHLRGLCKRFGECTVLENAGFELHSGEVHALLGENGAGKSTLMNLLTGVYVPDQGEIVLDGQPCSIRKPADAMAHGIGMVHQHYRLVERFSVAENLVLAADRAPELQRLSVAAKALQETAEQLGLALDPYARVADLSVAERQRAEICKVLALGAHILILDEPTAVLTDTESESLLAAIQRMANAGKGVILITHKLREVVAHSDRVTILRQGRAVASNLATESLTQADIAQLMMGDVAVSQRQPSNLQTNGPDLLVATGLSASRNDGSTAISNIGIRLRRGEIVGVAGVGGHGQPQLCEALMGLLPIDSGSIQLDGFQISQCSVSQRRSYGLRYIPADRATNALALDLPVSDNLALTKVASGSKGRFWISRKGLFQDAQNTITEHRIAGASPQGLTRLLSGGNAQKLVLARELDNDCVVAITHSPTRGLDVKSCGTVHTALRELTSRGGAVLLISEDLEEIMTLSDRILVMNTGCITGELPGTASASEIGALMIGGH
ncbi:ABC transporter ATP-binding protein [Marinobacter sp. F3R11]|uniref:ABC transporter ATP-binding protein n=1 Tax=Marinobacter sp. F3R11 TaxID=2267231 RepID=UPI000DE92EF1|nr:ATP-binding cassette domain-containing protein [Marinobacter sp. F3R11]RBW49965.1 ABC transporter [Marinobacter sp. F3R11]